MKGREIEISVPHMERVDEGWLAYVNPWAYTNYILELEGLKEIHIGQENELLYKYKNNYGVKITTGPEWKGKAKIAFIYWDTEEDWSPVTLFGWKSYAFNMGDLGCEFVDGQEVAGCSPEDVYKIIERVKGLRR